MWEAVSSNLSNVPTIGRTATNLLDQAFNFSLINTVLCNFCFSLNSNIYWSHSPLETSEYLWNTEKKTGYIMLWVNCRLVCICYILHLLLLPITYWYFFNSFIWSNLRCIIYELHVLFNPHHFWAGTGSILPFFVWRLYILDAGWYPQLAECLTYTTQHTCSLYKCWQLDVGFETKTNPRKLMSEVHLLALNNETVHHGTTSNNETVHHDTGFETVYV
jgi:hypothetical protein